MTDLAAQLDRALSDRYRIERKLGEGGMATVFLAHDERHDRPVALKVLRPELAAVIGAERFLAEIKTTANLQHPNILPLFDSGEADAFLYYVMPYVEGETLRERIEREQQLGVEEAVGIAEEVADALDYAHRQGVIHRDIKPANILLQEGRPVVADFGIALAVSAAGGGRLTETGLSLGTPHYMSPEQASADRDLNARSDLYSLGCVLYEMLAGQPPHTGPNAQSVLVRILTDDPRPVSELRRTVPAHVAAAVAKAVEKLPADRFHSVADFAAALRDPGFSYTPASTGKASAETGAGQGGAGGPGVAAPGRSFRTAALVEGVIILGLLAALVLAVRPSPDPRSGAPLRTTLGEDSINVFAGIAVSDDESTIAVSAMAGSRGQQSIWVRRSDDLEFREIPGTEGGVMPRFSPDGEWVAFQEWATTTWGGSGAIRRVPVGGGPIQDVASGSSFDWGPEGAVWYTDDRGLHRIAPGSGGSELMLASSDSVRPWLPHVLPDGRGVLLNAAAGSSGGIVLLDTRDGSLAPLVDQGVGARYLGTGHIFFSTPDGTGLVVGFDIDSYEVLGAPVPVLSGIWGPVEGFHALAVSPSGTLIRAVLEEYEPGERLAWVAMDGQATELPLPSIDFEEPRVSPDGRRIVYVDFFGNRLGVYDLNTGNNRRLPPDLGDFGGHGWLPDSRGLYAGGPPVRRVDLVGADSATLTVLSNAAGQLESVSPDGAWLVMRQTGAERGLDLALLSTDDLDGAPISYLRADWDEAQGRVSPDGRWMAYVSTQSGEPRIYLRSFPEPGEATLVSEAVAMSPVWDPDGSALYYEVPGAMVRAALTLEGTPRVDERVELFRHETFESAFARLAIGAISRNRYDIHPDGDRFLMVKQDIELGSAPVTVEVVTNWFNELRSRVGG